MSTPPSPTSTLTIGVLALQGAFNEHIQLLRHASSLLDTKIAKPYNWKFIEVRTADQLSQCDALIIPGGESTTISLVAEASGLMEPLRDFVKIHRRPTWGTCAGLILLSSSANRTKATGQSLIGGLSVRVNRNHFGRQTESFQADLHLPFLSPPPQSASTLDELRTEGGSAENAPFRAVFIRAPIVEALLPITDPAHQDDILAAEAHVPGTIVTPPTLAPFSTPSSLYSKSNSNHEVEVLARLHGRTEAVGDEVVKARLDKEVGDIVAVRQGNVFGCSFHPELTGDARIHAWWLEQVIQQVEQDKGKDGLQNGGNKSGERGRVLGKPM